MVWQRRDLPPGIQRQGAFSSAAGPAELSAALSFRPGTEEALPVRASASQSSTPASVARVKAMVWPSGDQEG
jgi:hypothetical protein